jgi:hypothetical protein
LIIRGVKLRSEFVAEIESFRKQANVSPSELHYFNDDGNCIQCSEFNKLGIEIVDTEEVEDMES